MKNADPAAGHGERCGANTRSGKPCRNAAGFKTDHVGVGYCHLHLGRTPNHRKAAEQELAEQAVETYGLPVDVEPRDALTQELHRTAGHVAWLALQIQSMTADELETERGCARLDRYHLERRQLAGVARDCVRAGIEERRVEIAARQAELIAGFARALVAELGIDPASEPARKAFRKHLTLIAGATA